MDEPAGQSAQVPAATGNSAPSPYLAHAVQALRTAQRNTLTLSQMADQKASILMGATFVVFSISISRALDGHLPWALAILAVFAFLSALLAVLVVMPSVSSGRRLPNEPNLLFFGHFAQIDEDEWTEDVLGRLETNDALYRMMLHDVYQNGLVLQRRKYRFLGYAYRTFVTGLVVTLVSFVVELALGG